MSQNQTERARIKPKDNFFITPSPSGSTQHRTKPPRRPPKPVTTKHEPKPQERANKRPFDKKKWRLQKYSKKYKLQQWEDRRKKAVLREYYRDVDPHERKFDVQKIYAQMDDEGEASADAVIAKRVPSDTQVESSGAGESKRKSTAKRAHLEFLRIKEEKQRQKEEALKRKQERAEAVKQYKKRKTEIYKKLSKKTKRGQPIMKDRMEVLLERIQNSLNS